MMENIKTQIFSLLKKKAMKNGVWLYLLQIFNTIVPLLTLPYITRIMTTEIVRFLLRLIYMDICRCWWNTVSDYQRPGKWYSMRTISSKQISYFQKSFFPEYFCLHLEWLYPYYMRLYLNMKLISVFVC